MPTDTSRTEAPSDLRRRILETARHMLVEKGHRSLSMRRLASRIGYSATSIYLHFDNRDALIHALIDEGMENLGDAMRATAEACSEASAPERLRALCETYVGFGLDHPEYYEVMFMLHTEHMQRFPAELYRRARRNLEVIAATLAEGSAAGTLDADEPKRAASSVWASLHGAVSLLLLQRVDVRLGREVFLQEVVGRVVRGFLPAEVGGETA